MMHVPAGDQSEPELSDSVINSLDAPFFVLVPTMRLR
jgi:hypothetical protein